jgi:hypothetical protein
MVKLPSIPDAPVVQTYEEKYQATRTPGKLAKMICKIKGHARNDGTFIDSHGNEDALSYCERCGEYDV